MVWSEDALHRLLRADAALEGAARRSAGVRGAPGDDAVFFAERAGQLVACLDHTIEGVHVESGTPAARTGRKAVDRALSDLAASAAKPRALLLGLSAPKEADERHLRGLLRAVRRRGLSLGAPLVGGDLACAPGATRLSVTALGTFTGRTPPARDRARTGSYVVSTGAFGGSRGRNGQGRHLRFEPRLSEGRWLYRMGAGAMMDTTDGLARDLARLAEASGVRIDLSHVPLHPDALRASRRSGRPALEHALGDGEDYELLASVPATRLPALLRGAARHCPGLSVLGRVRKGRGLWWLAAEGEEPKPLEAGGFDHGQS